MTAGPVARDATSPPIVAATSALLTWQHRRGGQAHCLIRLRTILTSDAASGLPVGPALDAGDRARDRRQMATAAMVSELRNNPRGREITSDFAGLAGAALRQLIPPTCPPEAVTWYAHHGPFSTYDHTDEPETLTLIDLRWDGQRYLDADGPEHRLLPPDEADRLISLLRLEPVEQVLAAWSWEGQPGMPAPRGTGG